MMLLAVATAMLDRGGEPEDIRWRLGNGLAGVGATVISGWRNLLQFLAFLGQTLFVLAALLPRPWRWRYTALVAQMQHHAHHL